MKVKDYIIYKIVHEYMYFKNKNELIEYVKSNTGYTLKFDKDTVGFYMDDRLESEFTHPNILKIVRYHSSKDILNV